MDWPALAVSLRLGLGTILILLPFGVWLGRFLAAHTFRGKLLVESLVTERRKRDVRSQHSIRILES